MNLIKNVLITSINVHFTLNVAINIKCDICQTEQDFNQICINCDISFGKYYCKVCYILDDQDRDIIHCDQCNICRIGTNESLFHCIICGCCFNKTSQESHKCHKDVAKNNCSICFADMFTANDSLFIMSCGHSIHSLCLEEYIKTNYKCPICSKSMFSMDKYFELLDEEIAQTPMPTEYEKITKNIQCFDCKEHSTAKFHVIGMKCTHCSSYNTTQI
jgi:RING finger/CHY zinc finger protein 1